MLHLCFDEVARDTIRQLNKAEKPENTVLCSLVPSLVELHWENHAKLVLESEYQPVSVIDQDARMEQSALSIHVGVVVQLNHFTLSQFWVFVGVVDFLDQTRLLLPVHPVQIHLVYNVLCWILANLQRYLRLRLEEQ